MSGHKRDIVTSGTVTRRDILKAGVLGGLLLPAMAAAGPAQAASRVAVPHDSGTMRIAFRNKHTGEGFSGAYRVGDRYLPEAFEQINTVLRDFRTGEAFPIDPRVLDIIYTMHYKMDSNKPFEILSGYRSPKTNSMLRRAGDGAAQNSLHMTGQAIDLRMPGYSTRRLYELAAGLKAGGTGYYGKSDFLHVDTGQVRRWS